jgi:hypothetical protein
LIDLNLFSVYVLETETILDSDETLRNTLKQFSIEVAHATEGAKPLINLVFCTEKDLVLKKP